MTHVCLCPFKDGFYKNPINSIERHRIVYFKTVEVGKRYFHLQNKNKVKNDILHEI